VILQCIRFLTQHYQLHEKDRQYRQHQADKQSRAPAGVGDDSELQTNDSVSVHSADSNSCEDQHSISCSVTPDVTVEAGSRASVSDITESSSGAVCGISENTVSDIASNADRCDGVMPLSSVVSVVRSTADTCITQCSNENGVIIADTSDKVMPCSHETGIMSDNIINTSTRLSNGTVDIAADTSHAVTKSDTGTGDITADTGDLVTHWSSDIRDMTADTRNTATQCNHVTTAVLVNDVSLLMNNNVDICKAHN